MARITGMISLAFAGALLATTSLAQAPAEPAMPGGDLQYPVDPARPFGDIDITAAGATHEEVEAYLGGLTGAQVIAVIRSCNVIRPGFGGDFEENPPANAPAAGGGAPAAGAPAPGAPAPGADIEYPADAVAFCGHVNMILFGIEDED